jgi:hypothetical protein
MCMIPRKQPKFKTKKQRNDYLRWLGVPIGCFYCNWAGWIIFRPELGDDFELDQFTRAKTVAIPCSCALGISIIKKAAAAQDKMAAEEAEELMLRRAKLARLQEEMHRVLCNIEKDLRGDPAWLKNP